MKVLLDSCVWGGAGQALERAGHEVVSAGAMKKDPGDEELLRIAVSEGRVLVTLDKDFGELAVVRGLKHSGIVRLVRMRSAMQGPAAVLVLERYGAELARGAIVTVEPGRVRIRLAEESEGE